MTIYCIIARDPKTNDEWVMPKTFETILETAEQCETYRIADPTARYRIENIEPTITAPYVNFPRLGDFTHDELFPETFDNMTSTDCRECGAHVRVGAQERHVTWHSKLLP